MNQTIQDYLSSDADAASIFQRVSSRGTVSIGELNVSPDLDPAKARDALGRLESLGLITHTGHYYSISALGASVARSLQRQQQKFF